MNREQLIAQIKKKQSFLCVGLDTDINKIPKHLLELEDPIFEFNKQIIDSTKGFCVAYKPNIAFYESMGVSGWESLQKTLDYIPENIFTIADAKRGDIGNTSSMYARAFFENMNFDSVTVAPYMGSDSVTPFLAFEDKWAIVLALTSNKGGLKVNGKGEVIDNYDDVIPGLYAAGETTGGLHSKMYILGCMTSSAMTQGIVAARNAAKL